MEIHVVQRGETIASIAEKYNISADRLIRDNGLTNPFDLVIGQCIVITYPELTYMVQEGDTLESIAVGNDTSILQLLRNNPFLSNREFIYPGEILVIRYGDKKGKISINGYTNPFIRRDLLRNALPYLTYLTVFGYRVTENADIIEPNDEELLEMAKEYHVAPIMLVSTLTFQGVGSAEAAYHILYDDNLVYRYIENILSVLKRKEFYGVSFIFSYLSSEHVEVYNNFTEKVTRRLNDEGFIVLVSITPMMVIENDMLTFEKIDYSDIGRYANQVVAMNYNWGSNFGPPKPAASIYTIRLFVEYLQTMIPPEKMILGLPLIGYSWELPYIIGVTEANALSYEAAINLAQDTESEIKFDLLSQNPYYEYVIDNRGIPRTHIVWFIDARSIEVLTNMSSEYNIPGNAFWNIMTYFPQMWLIINTQYEIDNILPES